MSTTRRFRPIRTYSDAWLQRHRETHARHAVFGTHRHPYLRKTIERLARATTGEERPSLLDYGCGKGVFLREMRQSGQFRHVMGYDPAVDAFRQRPAQVYDIVLCLDVLDQTEDEFVEPLIEDVAQFAGRFAVFDVITVQVPELAHLNPRSAETWGELIGRRMVIDEMIVRAATEQELREGACPERVIVVGSPSRAS